MRLVGFPSLFFTLVLSTCASGPAWAQPAPLDPYEVMHALSGHEGLSPQSGLVRGADNRLYGTATEGGPDGVGTIYRVATDGTFEIVHTFLVATPANGLNPVSLIRGRDTHLYGTTDYGGPFGDGVIYRLNWSEATQTYSGITPLHAFDCANGEGGDPWGAMVEGPDGALYGLTNPSSTPDPACTLGSTVFKLNKDGSGFRILAQFDYLVTGSYQFGPLAVASDGSIYGTLNESFNPAFQFGSVFQIAPDGAVTYPKVFGGGVDGAHPFSGVVQGSDRAFYGTTSGGGTDGVGTIFRIDENGTFTTLYSFDSASVHSPLSPLVVGGDGKLYGAGHAGGGAVECGVDVDLNPFGCGGSYIFDPPAPIGSGAGFSVHAIFDHDNTGSSPYGPLGVGPDRHLYGTQSGGGAFNQGTLFGLLDIEVANRPPVPVALAFPQPAEALTDEGATVALNALGSWDADFDDLTYAWTLPSEATIVDEAPDHSTLDATFPEGTWPVTLTVSDGTTTRNVVISITVADAPPIFDEVSPISVPAQHTGGADVSYPIPAAMDLIDGDRSAYVTCVPPSGSTFLVGSTIVTCSVSDLSGHVATTSFSVTVTATLILDVPGNQTLEATGPSGAPFNYTVTATGSEEGLVPTCVPALAVFPIGTTIVNCSVVDPIFGPASASFTIHVVDTTAPRIVLESITEFNAVGPEGGPAPYVVSAVDDVDSSVQVVCTPPPGDFPLGVRRVTCEAEDDSGNHSTFSFDVAVRDSDLPVLTVPAAMIVEAQSAAGALVSYSAPATDVTSPGGVTVSCIPASDTTFGLGATIVECTANDGAGHSSTGSFVVTVRDTTPPQISGAPNNITVPSSTPAGAVVTYALPTAIDVVSGATTVTCNPGSGSIFPFGTTTVLCSSSDSATPAPTTATATFTVTVTDGVAPVVSVPAPIVAEAAGPGGLNVTFTATALDDRDGVRTTTCVPASGSLFGIGTTAVRCTASDLAGNEGSATFNVTVRDTTAPVLATANVVAEATSAAGGTVSFSPTATDAVGVVGPITCSRAPGSPFAIGVTPVSCDARDAAGNVGSASFTVTVRDTTGPVITVPANIVAVTANLSGANVSYPAASAVDLVDGARAVSCTPASGSLFPVGVTSVNCESFDSRGNRSTRSFTVTVVSKPPTLKVTLSPGVLWPPNHKMVTITATIVATSAVGPAPIVTLVSITSNEPDNGLGDGDTANDIQGAAYGTNDRVFQLRAERSGKGSDRVYTVTYKAASALNPSIATIVTATVTVPHDMKGKTK